MNILLYYQKLIDQIQYRISELENLKWLSPYEEEKLFILRKYKIDLILQMEYFLGVD